MTEPSPAAGEATAEPGGAPAGMIHDIGYRHYDGARLGRGAVARALYVSTLRAIFGLGRTAKSKVTPFSLVGVMLLPALTIEIVLNVTRSMAPPGFDPFDQQPLPYTSYVLVTQAAVVIFLGSQAPAVFSRDLRFRTVALYFARPLTRLDYVTAKFLALTTGLTILCLAPLLLMLIGGLLAGLPPGPELLGFAQASVGVVILALMLAGLAGLIASATVRRGIAVAAIVTVAFVSVAIGTVVGQLAQLQQNDMIAGLAALISPFTLIDAIQGVLFGTDPQMVQPGQGAAWTTLYPAAGAVLIAGLFLLTLARYRRVTGA